MWLSQPGGRVDSLHLPSGWDTTLRTLREEGDRVIHRASSLGGCLKSQIAAALGEKPIPPDTTTELIMQEGALHEADVIARLQASGMIVSSPQEEVNLLFGVGTVRGHLDGTVTDPLLLLSRARVLEIKSMGRDAYRRFMEQGWETPGLVQKYKWQLSVYMHAKAMEGLLVAKCRDNGQMAEFGVERPFFSLDEIEARVAYIEDHVARGVLPEECDRDWFCPHRYLCEPQSRVTDQPVGEIPPLPLEAIRYYELGALIRNLETERKMLRPTLRSWLGERRSLIKDGYKVSWVEKTVPDRVVRGSHQSYPIVKKIDDEEGN